MSLRTAARTDTGLLKKAVGYRLLSILVTTLVALLLVGDIALATNIGLAANIAKFLLYYGYELAWAGHIGRS